MENLCTVGTMCESECNLITYSKTVGYDLLLEMGPDSREILMWITITMQWFVFTTRMPSSNSILCNKRNAATQLVCTALQRKVFSLFGHMLYLNGH